MVTEQNKKKINFSLTEKSELSQSWTRVVVGIGSILLTLSLGADFGNDYLIGLLLYFFGYSTINHLWIAFAPRSILFRQFLAIFSDIFVVSMALFLLSPAGIAIYPVYLWIIVGNGYRYGSVHLTIALTVSVIGFAINIFYHEYWSNNIEVAIGLLVGIIILPLFYSKILKNLEEANQKLAERARDSEYQATHDALTGLPNRPFIFAFIDQEIRHFSRRSDYGMAVLFIDLDEFKPINDRYGHKAGDTVLNECGKRMTDTVRETDMVARLGGDEYLIVISDIMDNSVVQKIADRLIKALSNPFYIEDIGRLNISASIGIAMTEKRTDAETLVKWADDAMYAAKKKGRNQYAWTPMPAEILNSPGYP